MLVSTAEFPNEGTELREPWGTRDPEEEVVETEKHCPDGLSSNPCLNTCAEGTWGKHLTQSHSSIQRDVEL